MISVEAAYYLGYYQAQYSGHRIKAYEYLGHEDNDIAIGIIPRVLNDTETLLSVIIYNPTRPSHTYHHLDTVHHNDVEAYVEEIKRFIDGMNVTRTNIRLMPELAKELA